jgi:uncharacterized protein (TIGR02466 family)
MFQITPAFAVPFAEARLPQADALNTELAALFLAREAEGARWRNPQTSMRINPALFESAFEVFAWPEPCVQRLREFCWGALSRLIAQLNGYSSAEMATIQIHSHTWFHVTRTGGFFGLHNHPMASWSGVYCVTPGEDDGSHPDSGKLHFANPNQLANMYLDAANTRIRLPYGMAGRSYRLEAGQLILFPSWVCHEVLPFHGRGERITVAFNCWFTRPDQAPAAPYPDAA